MSSRTEKGQWYDGEDRGPGNFAGMREVSLAGQSTSMCFTFNRVTPGGKREDIGFDKAELDELVRLYELFEGSKYR